MFFSVRSFIVSLILALVTPLIIAPLVGVGLAEHYIVYFIVTLVAVYLGTVLCHSSVSVPHAVSSNTSTPESTTEDESDEDEDDDRELGTVKWFNSSKGFGFLTMDSGDDVFVHYRAIRGRGRRFLIEGQKVRFHVTEGEKGKQAENVSIVK